MSDYYLGLPINISHPLDIDGSIDIASSTNATPIEITTSAAHGLTDGEEVLITHHETNYSANGRRIITVVNTTQFTIVHSDDGTSVAGVGVGGATGRVHPMRIDPQFTIPEDAADDLNAASVNVGFEDHGDKSQWLAGRIGPHYLANSGYGRTVANAGTDDPAAGWLSGTAVDSAWTRHSGADLSTFAPTSTVGDENLSVFPNDVLEIVFVATVNVTGGSDVAFGIKEVVSEFGAAFSYTVTPDQTVYVKTGTYGQLVLRAFIDVGTATYAKKFDACLFSRKRGAAGSSTFELFGARAWHWKVYRRRQR